MGASILPICIHKGKVYFLFGKEREMDYTPGWSDFGGGSESGESYLDTAVREGSEEMTGFLGGVSDVRKLLKKHGSYELEYQAGKYKPYRVHMFPMEYDAKLAEYYNNNQRFLQQKLKPDIIADMKIFEKAQIRWIAMDELKSMRPQFRDFYKNVVDLILTEKKGISEFARKCFNKRCRTVKIRGQKKNKRRQTKRKAPSTY
tara:strand:+ start:93 stop:698 length:606 start_codon:yes stop_codon:yes gene_type:complete